MAQEFFKQLLPGVEAFSRGLYADSSYVTPQKVVQALLKHHISYTAHTATPLCSADLQQANFIFCMEKEHEEFLLDRYAQHTDKIWLLNEFAYGKQEDIADPISLEGRAFEKSAAQLYQACSAAANRIKQEFCTQK